jgi:PPP family 3-phenylpropionic acid transporter
VVAVRDHGVDYGRVRAAGSIAFIATATLGGWLLADEGAPIVLWLSLGMLALTFTASAGLPDLRTKPASRLHASLSLLLQRRFLIFMLATTLIQSSHVVYYGFASIHWRAVGISDALIGALWSEGVIAEIVLFTLSARLRFAPRTLLLLGAAGALIRWVVLGTTDAVGTLALAQTLHALTFGCTHLAAMRFIMREVPPEAGSTAQSLYFSLAGGGAAAIAMAAAGVLYADWGAGAYYAMASVALAGGAVALATPVSRLSKSAEPRLPP